MEVKQHTSKKQTTIGSGLIWAALIYTLGPVCLTLIGGAALWFVYFR